MNKRVIAVTVLIFAMFMDLVDSTIVNTALPAIQESLGATAAQLEWTIGGYMLAFAGTLITGGRVGDIYGRKTIFVLGIAGFTAASLMASLADTPTVLVLARVIQGAFAGLMVPQVLSTVQVLFKPEERGPIYGIIGLVTALGSVAGLVLGGWLITADAFGADWRSIFLVNLPIGAVLIVAALIVVPNTKSERPLKLDLLGVVLASGTVFLLTFALFDGRHEDWAWWIWTMLAAAPVTGLLFVLHQKKKLARDGSPLIPLYLFSNHGFRSGIIVQVISWAATGTYMLIVGYYLQAALGFSALATGVTLTSMTAGAILTTPILTPLAKFGRGLILVGGLVQAVSFLWIRYEIVNQGAELSGWDLALPLALSGLGMTLLFPTLHNITLATVDPENAGAASGTFTTFQQVGYVLGIALVGVVFFDIAGANPTPETLRDAVEVGLWISVGSFTLAGISSLLMPKASALPQAAPDARGEQLVHH
ncbi:MULTISPECIES: MFS transporter [unclassified Streptomyces]|uniref:MFS transporter n=1 Tax=unclassified Streptomyces TaxID=2593676 RepID=UPI0005653C0D|nr:MFS transporter [Streptomyces sp. NRRL F-2747]